MTVKLCECGCGNPAPIASQTHRKDGHVKGQPVRFIRWHRSKRPIKGLYRQVNPERGRELLLHRHRAEKALGKPLPPGAVVHHADGSTDDDAPLVICQDEAYHKLLHVRMRVKAAGGNPNTDKICKRCREVKPLDAFGKCLTAHDGKDPLCRSCSRSIAQQHRDERMVS